MLSLIYASSLLYAAAIHAAFVLTQSIAENSRVQYAVVHCKSHLSATTDLNLKNPLTPEKNV
jgi:hypothetical protein